MSQAGYTPIQLYYSTTAAATPSSGNLANGELAINITDGKLFYKDNGGTVRVLAGTGGSGVVAGSNTQVQFNNNGVFGASSGLTWDGTTLTANALTVSNAATLSGGTANGVAYLNGSKVLTTGSALTFDGSAFTVSGTGQFSVASADAIVKLTRTTTSAGSGWLGASSGYSFIVYSGDLSKARQFTVAQNAPSDALALDAAGNLGLLVAPSAWGGNYFQAFQLGNRGGYVAGGTSSYSSNSHFAIGNNGYFNAAGNWIATVNDGGACQYYQVTGEHRWNTAGSVTAGSTIPFSRSMTLDANGNLVLGATSGYTGFTIAGNSQQLAFSGSGLAQINNFRSGDLEIVNRVSGSKILLYYGAGSLGATLDQNGNFLVGTTSATTGISGVETALVLKGNSSNKAASFVAVNASGTGASVFGTGDSAVACYAGTTTNHPFVFQTNNLERGRFLSTGQLCIGFSGAWNDSAPYLQVRDGIVIGSTASAALFTSIKSTNGYDLTLTANANPANLGVDANIIFRSGNSGGGGPAELGRFVSTGDFKVGANSYIRPSTYGWDIQNAYTYLGIHQGADAIFILGIAYTGTPRIQPATDNYYDLGNSSYRFKTVYAATGTINTSDANLKQDIADLDAAEARVAMAIKGLVKKFRFKDAVAKKGDAARIHVGVVAQEVADAFEAEGLDPNRYAMFCSDTWYEVDGVPFSDMKNPYTADTPNAVAVTRLGIRYDELLAFVISAI